MKGGSSTGERALSFGTDAGFVLRSDDPTAIAWIEEYFGPALAIAEQATGPRVEARVSASEHARLAALVPADAGPRPWFAFDQKMLSLPSRETAEGLLGLDAERGCVLGLRPEEMSLVGDPRNRRWRFTLVMALQELIAAALRGRQLEVHAAAVEAEGRAILMVGPKRAGKTTLSFHLLRSGLCRSIANDRVFAGPEPESIVVRGVPTSLRVGPAMAVEFPEIAAGLPWIDRPHLYVAEELADPPPGAGPPETDELMLSLAQVAAQLGVERRAAAPLGTLLFPEVDTTVDGWLAEPLSARQVGARIWANLFGIATHPRPGTVLEELEGSAIPPPRDLADLMAETAPGFRVVLGRGAYDDPDFAERLLARVAPEK